MNDTLTTSARRMIEAAGNNLELATRILERNMDSLLAAPGTPREEPYRGATPVDEIFRFDTMRVLRYRGTAPLTCKTPLVLVPSLINRAYIMDLMPSATLAGSLREAGIPVYLIDWGTPGPQHDHLSFRFFIDDLVSMATREACRDTGAAKASLLGYCMGGTMSLMHCALHPDRIEKLVMLAAPVNFHDDGPLSAWARKEAFDVDTLVDVLGHADCSMLQSSFQLIKPFSSYQKWKNVFESSLDAKASESIVALESWLNDNVNVPGEAYRGYVKLCYHDNALRGGSFELDGVRIDLSTLRVPTMNVMASKDHIVPIESARCLSELVTGPVNEVVIDAGHIGVVMGRKARGMFDTVAKFLRES
ncbi:MAG TPA: alpha/beta fold hydrolase [Candidatus Ozemobacteraceae bacterium]|nr:alpha/beta fold hydrolase [Candidatus Ozemobacteraceae bacterium]